MAQEPRGPADIHPMTARNRRKCPISEEPEPFSVFVSWEYSHEEGGEIREGQEDDDYPSREPIYRDHTVYGVFVEADVRGKNRYGDREDVPFDPRETEEVWLVGVTYSSGSTFGSTHGNFTIVGVYDDEDEAHAVARDIRADDDDKNINKYGEPAKGHKPRYDGYKAWTGYFERLEGVEVQRFRMNEEHGAVRY